MTPTSRKLALEWRPVVGYEGLYEVSNLGSVRSKLKILKPTKTVRGYHRVSLYKDGNSKIKSVHSIVMEAFVGKRPDGFHIEHIDHNKTNNALSNIRYCSPQENYQRGRNDGIYPSGQFHSQTKLTIEQAYEIKNISGLSNRHIAKMYDMDNTTINALRSGRTWSKALAEFEKEILQ